MKEKGIIVALCLCLVLGLAGCISETPKLDAQEGTYDQEFCVKIINLQKGERAYYTLDGSEPGLDSIVYPEDGIPLIEGQNVVKVMKVGTDGKASQAVTAQYIITPQLPQLATSDGVYNAEFAAKITNLREGQRAYFTLDGSVPNENSALYTDLGIPLREGENQVRLVKYDEFGNNSDILTAYLNIEPYEPDYSNSFAFLHKRESEIYYVQYVHSEFLYSYPSMLYSYNLTNGSTKVVVDRDMGHFIIRNDNIYYEYEDEDMNLHWLWASLDGRSHGIMMKTDEENFVNIHLSGIMVDDWIYYQYHETGGGWNLHRFNVNTLATEQVGKGDVSGPLFLVGRDILYTSGGSNIYLLDADTAESTLITPDRGYSFNVFGGHIYCYAEEPEKNVYRMRLDGTNREPVPGIQSNEFVVGGDRIYYGMTDGIHSRRIDGEDHKLIASNVPYNLKYYRGRLFFNGGTHNHSIYCLDLDTGEVSMLLETGSSYAQWYFIGGEVYYVHTKLHTGQAGLYHLTEHGLEKLAGEIE